MNLPPSNRGLFEGQIAQLNQAAQQESNRQLARAQLQQPQAAAGVQVAAQVASTAEATAEQRAADFLNARKASLQQPLVQSGQLPGIVAMGQLAQRLGLQPGAIDPAVIASAINMA